MKAPANARAFYSGASAQVLVMPNFLIFEKRVVGGKLSSSAAPPLPATLNLHCLKIERIYAFSFSLTDIGVAAVSHFRAIRIEPADP